MKLKCINVDFPCNLTYGKIYDLIEEQDYHYIIQDDTDRHVEYFKYRFEKINEGANYLN